MRLQFPASVTWVLITDLFLAIMLAVRTWCLSHNIWISAAHIPGKDNVVADQLSPKRVNMDAEWMIGRNALQSVLAKLEILPSIDLFASRLKAQLPRFVSYKPDRAAVALDAFSVSWKNEECFCCFPFQCHHTCSAEGTTGPDYRNPGCSGLANRSRPQESWLSRTGEQTRPQESWLFRIGEQHQATGILIVTVWPAGPGHRNPRCSGLANRTRPQVSWLFRISQQDQATGILVVQDWRTDQATGILVVPDWPTEAGHRNSGCPGLANRTRPQESWLSRIGEQDQTTGILVVPDWTT